MAFEFLKAWKLNKQVNDALPVAEVIDWDILSTLDLLEDHSKEDILSYFERFGDVLYISEFYKAVEDFGEHIVNSFIDLWGIEDVEHVEDAYNGEYRSEAEFAEELCNDCFCNDLPYWVSIDWQNTWDSALRFDYDFSDGIIWRTSW
tara:strand:- start:2029 stop:2469 length:441 start_codon:yes stop_codon:yes gene_type:complete